jgi:hypothetical protein
MVNMNIIYGINRNISHPELVEGCHTSTSLTMTRVDDLFLKLS